MRLFSSRKTRNDELRAKGAKIFSAYSTDHVFWEERFVPYLAELSVALNSGDIETLAEVESHVQALEAMPPLQRALCSASILHSTKNTLDKAGARGSYFRDLVSIAGVSGCSRCIQDVLDREDRGQAKQLVKTLDVLLGFAIGMQRAQVIYLKGHLEYGVLNAPASAFANALRHALTELQRDTDPRLSAERAAQQRAWKDILVQLER